jgi:hypothetical protein
MGQTYREAIQSLVDQIEILYDKAGALRDAADLNEKPHWNLMRTLTRDASSNLRKLDDKLPEDRATMQLRGNY